MSRMNPQQQYLVQVLGLRSYIRPAIRPTSQTGIRPNGDVPECIPVASSAEVLTSAALRESGEPEAPWVFLMARGAAAWPLDDMELVTMYERMLGAMKLSRAGVLTLEVQAAVDRSELPLEIMNLLSTRPAGVMVCFGDPASLWMTGHPLQNSLGNLQTWRDWKVMPTHALEDLAMHPDRKRATWSHLQQLMKETK